MQVDQFKAILQKTAKTYGINTKTPNIKNRIPPASLHSFLRENKTIEGLVIASHDDEFDNHFYHSFYDDRVNINYEYEHITNDSIQQYISDISMVLAKSLYEELSGHPYASTLEDPTEIVSFWNVY